MTALPDTHPRMHKIRMKEKRVKYLSRPKPTTMDLRWWVKEVEFLNKLARTMVNEVTTQMFDQVTIASLEERLNKMTARHQSASKRVRMLEVEQQIAVHDLEIRNRRCWLEGERKAVPEGEG